jgi:hypothetical protein
MTRSMNHTATSYPLELGMPPGVAGCLQMLVAHPSEYIIDELWTRLHKLYVSCDSGGSRVRLCLGSGRLAPAIRTAGNTARDSLRTGRRRGGGGCGECGGRPAVLCFLSSSNIHSMRVPFAHNMEKIVC